MGARARVGAAACLVASGLVMGSPLVPTANADREATALRDRAVGPRADHRPGRDAKSIRNGRSGKADGGKRLRGRDEIKPVLRRQDSPQLCGTAGKDGCGPAGLVPVAENDGGSSGGGTLLQGPGLDGFTGVTGVSSTIRSGAGRQGDGSAPVAVSGETDHRRAAPVRVDEIGKPPADVTTEFLTVQSVRASVKSAVVGADPAPRAAATENALTPQAPPVTAGRARFGTPLSAYRGGYGKYLTDSSAPRIAAVGLTGVIGILLLTGVGGLLGYRQAMAGRSVRARDVARFTD